MEDRSTAAETAACSSNGQAARLDAYIIHTPPPTTEKVLASNVPVVPHFPLSGNVGMPTVTLLQPAEIVIHNGSEGTIFGTPEGQEGELAMLYRYIMICISILHAAQTCIILVKVRDICTNTKAYLTKLWFEAPCEHGSSSYLFVWLYC